MTFKIKKALTILLSLVSLSLPFILLFFFLNSANSNDTPPNLEKDPTTSQPFSENSSPSESKVPSEYNIKCVHDSNGTVICDTFIVDNKFCFEIDALVCTRNVNRVSLYEYIPTTISDDQRSDLLKAYFKERFDEVYHHTVGNSNCWLLLNDTEYYHFGYNRSPQHIDESGFFLVNHKVGLVDVTEGMRESLDDVGFPLSDAFSQCDLLIKSLVGDLEYTPSIVRPISTARPSVDGAYWIVYRRYQDGIPVIANWDLKFFVTKNEVVKMVGTLYDVQELSLEKKVISVEDALVFIKKQASLIDFDFLKINYFFEETIPVSMITFEYLVLPGPDGRYIATPIWRFQLGETEEQRNIHRDKVIAVNALTGELIAEYRGR